MHADVIAKEDECPWLVEGCPEPNSVPEGFEARLCVVFKVVDKFLAQQALILVLHNIFFTLLHILQIATSPALCCCARVLCALPMLPFTCFDCALIIFHNCMSVLKGRKPKGGCSDQQGHVVVPQKLEDCLYLLDTMKAVA